MKDKLEKHHKTKSYFLRKKVLIILLIALGISASVAIPFSVSAIKQARIAETHRQNN